MIIQTKDRANSISIDKKVFELFQRFKEKTTNDDSEVWGAYIGDNGAGKSLRAMHDTFSMDGELIPLKNICFDKDEFITAVVEAKQGEKVIADEGISIFFNRASMTKEGRLIAELIDQVRQKNLVILLCIRNLLSLDDTVRSKLIFVSYVWEDRERRNDKIVSLKGNAGYFIRHDDINQVQLLINYLKAKRKNPMGRFQKPNPMFYHKGNPIGLNYSKPFYPVVEGMEAYLKKKHSILDKYKPKLEAKANTEKDFLSKTIWQMREKGMSFKKISDILGKSVGTTYNYYKNYKEFEVMSIHSDQKV